MFKKIQDTAVTDYQRERQLKSKVFFFFSLGNSSDFGTKANAEDREKQADRVQRKVTESTTSMPQFSRTKSTVTAFPDFPREKGIRHSKACCHLPNRWLGLYCKSQSDHKPPGTSLVTTTQDAT